jgi:hypothetical protein
MAGNGSEGSGLNETWRTEVELMIECIAPRSYVAFPISYCFCTATAVLTHTSAIISIDRGTFGLRIDQTSAHGELSKCDLVTHLRRR